MADSVDVRTRLTQSDTIGSGFLSTMIPIGDTAVVGFVSGLHIYDSESLEVHPYRCGGIVRITDKGQSWQRVSVPHVDPYFLGTITGSNGVLIASYTTVVRDTAKMRQEELRQRNHEPLFTTMQDCHIIRSDDGGLTWQKVYSRSANLGFRFVGGSGIRLNDGKLLINGVDGVHESLDNGITWDFHEAGFSEQTNVISLFTDNDAQDIYYCTTTGVFKSQRATSVEQEDEHATTGNLTARTWTGHQQAWAQAGQSCIGLATIVGSTMVPLAAPAPGLYRAQLRGNDGATTTQVVLVTVKE